jgi:hypothetical protein
MSMPTTRPFEPTLSAAMKLSVPEPLRQAAPHLEMEGAARVRRDVAVHLFDLALQLVRIDLRVHRSKLTELRARSPERMPKVCRDFAGRRHCRNRRCPPV